MLVLSSGECTTEVKAVVQHQDQLSWEEVPDLQAKRGEVRIAVHASAVNRADLSQRAGGYPPPPGASPIMGLECSGVVDSVGEGVTSIDEGDRVCALLSGGGYAESVNCTCWAGLENSRKYWF